MKKILIFMLLVSCKSQEVDDSKESISIDLDEVVNDSKFDDLVENRVGVVNSEKVTVIIIPYVDAEDQENVYQFLRDNGVHAVGTSSLGELYIRVSRDNHAKAQNLLSEHSYFGRYLK